MTFSRTTGEIPIGRVTGFGEITTEDGMRVKGEIKGFSPLLSQPFTISLQKDGQQIGSIIAEEYTPPVEDMLAEEIARAWIHAGVAQKTYRSYTEVRNALLEEQEEKAKREALKKREIEELPKRFMPPSQLIGMIVHYVPDSDYTQSCFHQPAVIQHIWDSERGLVRLTVFTEYGVSVVQSVGHAPAGNVGHSWHFAYECCDDDDNEDVSSEEAEAL